MIKLENRYVTGWEEAVRGMRNPMNSWDRSDSDFGYNDWGDYHLCIGPNDLGLMKRLCKAGSVHRKFMRMITVYVDITAPLYWWPEFDTYKVGTTRNSCSFQHKGTSKPFSIENFCVDDKRIYNILGANIDKEKMSEYTDYCAYKNQLKITFKQKDKICKLSEEGFTQSRISNVFDISQATVSEIIRGQRCNNAELFDRCIMWEKIINELNRLRDCYLDTKDYEYFRAIRQLLPSGYLQKSTVMLNYEVLSNIYYYRKDHKLDEWHVFCDWIKGLPYSELITGEYDG